MCLNEKKGNQCGGSGATTAGAGSDFTEARGLDMCVVQMPMNKFMHNSEVFMFTYDSGTECSLIKGSITLKFAGKRIVYMDDLMITAVTVMEALERLNTILDILTKAGFFLNIKNVPF